MELCIDVMELCTYVITVAKSAYEWVQVVFGRLTAEHHSTKAGMSKKAGSVDHGSCSITDIIVQYCSIIHPVPHSC
jgi:hypothetical protein